MALYGDTGKRWALTERGATALARSRDRLQVGPSSVHWRGDALEIEIDELTVPIPGRIRGRVRVFPPFLSTRSFTLDQGGRHHWWPASPRCRVEVDLTRPGLRWQGEAYFDANWGSEPLEARFVRWDWSRAMLDDGSSVILYDKTLQGEPPRPLALRITPDGALTEFAPPPAVGLPTTRVWRIERATQSEPGPPPRVIRTLEDTPFYARSLIESRLLGQTVTKMHESLSLQRFRQPWVQLLLPFRMPRVAGSRPT